MSIEIQTKEQNYYVSIKKLLPEYGIEKLGYSSHWIDEDFNPNGTRLFFLSDDMNYTSSYWCNSHDEYHTRHSEYTKGNEDKSVPSTDWKERHTPQYWMDIPKFLPLDDLI